MTTPLTTKCSARDCKNDATVLIAYSRTPACMQHAHQAIMSFMTSAGLCTECPDVKSPAILVTPDMAKRYCLRCLESAMANPFIDCKLCGITQRADLHVNCTFCDKCAEYHPYGQDRCTVCWKCDNYGHHEDECEALKKKEEERKLKKQRPVVYIILCDKCGGSFHQGEEHRCEDDSIKVKLAERLPCAVPHCLEYATTKESYWCDKHRKSEEKKCITSGCNNVVRIGYIGCEDCIKRADEAYGNSIRKKKTPCKICSSESDGEYCTNCVLHSRHLGNPLMEPLSPAKPKNKRKCTTK